MSTFDGFLGYKDVTKLPVKVFERVNNSKRTIVVLTPHKGEVLIEEDELSRTMFGANARIDRDTEDVLRQIGRLEREAREFLFNEWLTGVKKDLP